MDDKARDDGAAQRVLHVELAAEVSHARVALCDHLSQRSEFISQK